MEAKPNAEQSPSNPATEHLSQSPQSSKKTKKYLLILVSILVLLAVGFGGYYFGAQKQTPQQILPSPSPLMTTTPTQSPVTPGISPIDAGIPIQANTVSFTRVNGAVYLRYKGKIYSEEAANKNDPSLTNLPNPDTYTWYGLVDAPVMPANTGFDELFDFKVFPNTYNFVFIMRWPVDDMKTDYKIFYYDAFAANNKVSLLYTSTQGDNGNDYTVARIKQISQDGKYIAFNMLGCWNCGGHMPKTLLFSLATKATKQIGMASYFAWKENGNYEYKEYKVIPCDPPLEGPGECSEDPNNLPLLTGSL